ncbi:ANK1 [Symbiodinium natans]|uniref:ANK1 protein n=1 Tax=Symbiodinium natans TaxID=878477 RepID=A0A812M903_9DINO|nr:ANK1 [Symbiodinium natans]
MGDAKAAQPKPSLAKLLKQCGIDPNALSFEDAGERRTLLCLVIEEAVKLNNDLSKVDLLIEARADPTRRSETGSFPLMLASQYSNLKLARKLLQARAEVNQQDTRLVTPLHAAVHEDSAQMVQLLLMHKANVNVQDQVGQTPIFFAGSTTAIAALVDAKADLHHLNKKGQSALHLAAHNGRYEAVVYFTDHEFLAETVDMQVRFSGGLTLKDDYDYTCRRLAAYGSAGASEEA